MTRLLGLMIAATLLVLVSAAPAGAALQVTHTPADPGGATGSLITIVDDGLPAPVNDAVAIQQNGTASFTITAAGLVQTGCDPPVGNSVTCPFAESLSIDLGGGNDVLTPIGVTVPVAVAGGAGTDQLSGGSAGDVLAGGSEDDTLNGGPGRDEYFGDGGADVIVSRDATAERIACGAGDDRVDNDFTDIIAECERGTDNDKDGFSTAVDCDDTKATTFPGAPDALENGVDEDCDGKDDVNLDRDGDGVPIPLDCNDANPRIRPGRTEIRGNKVDENCDKRILPLATLPSLVSTRWRITSDTLQLVKLIVRNAPKGARVSVTCDGPGCTFGKRKSVKVKRDLAPAKLHPFFGQGRLRPGARVTVRITASGAIGRVYRYKLERNVLPTATIRCLRPGSSKERAC